MNTKTILLVDDDSDMIRMEERWLTKEGYSVITALSGREAIESLNAMRPDLILLDYSMPDMDGAATLSEIRSNPATKDIPVFFLTGMEDPESLKDAERFAPLGYLQKSLGKKTVLLALSEYFGSGDR